MESVARAANHMVISWTGPAGWDHTLQRAAQMPPQEWEDIETRPSAGSFNSATVQTTGVAPAGFFRVVCRPHPVGGGPRLFFSDLESGPNHGGEGGLGVYLTLYGERFGEKKASSIVTIGGGEVARYVLWAPDSGARGLDRAVVQLGPKTSTGAVVLTVDGKPSNPLPFTVREGRIYFVIPEAPEATDEGPGTFARPFRSLYQPRKVMQAGDVVYLKGGRIRTTDPAGPGWDATLMLDPDSGAARGTPDLPVAYIGYPGDSPVLGSPDARRGILLTTGDIFQTGYVLANLTITEASSPFALSGAGHRIIGNTIFAAAHDDSGAMSVNTDTSDLRIFGNQLRANGQTEEKLQHAFYIGGYGTNRFIEFGWNQIEDQRGGRGIQLFGHLDGDWIDEVRIHDNWIAGSELDNILIGGTDGATEVIGTVEVYNNVLVEAGGSGLRVNDPRGIVTIRNNTFYQNQAAQVYLQRAGDGTVIVESNIFVAGPGQAYFAMDEEDGQPFAPPAARRNLYHHGGPCPAWDVECLAADPLFVDPENGDFRVRAGSPAIDAGLSTGPALDFLGHVRPLGGARDLGAFEFGPPVP